MQWKEILAKAQKNNLQSSQNKAHSGRLLKIFSKFSEKTFKLLLVQITDKIKKNKLTYCIPNDLHNSESNIFLYFIYFMFFLQHNLH